MLTNILQIADLWKEKGNPEKAIMALRWGLKEIEGSGCEKELASLWQMLLLTLSMFEQEYDELEEAKKHIRQAVRVEQGNCLLLQKRSTINIHIPLLHNLTELEGAVKKTQIHITILSSTEKGNSP